jgi:hypothetical protein
MPALHIANQIVVEKAAQAAALCGLNKTEAVHQALDMLISKKQEMTQAESWAEFRRLADAIPRIPLEEQGPDGLEWDENGLPI